MRAIGIDEARSNFALLLRRVAAGEGVVIARGSTPIVRVVLIAPDHPQRLGIDTGKFTVPDDFNHPTTKDRSDIPSP